MISRQRIKLVDERMDADDVDPDELARSLRFIRRVNKVFGYNDTVVSAAMNALLPMKSDRPLRVLDVATGSADLPEAMLTTADEIGLNLEITALDRHAATLEFASRVVRDSRVKLLRGDALSLPFEIDSFDLVVSAMFLHHLETAQAVAALREMRRVSRGAVIAADLIRCRRAMFWITLFTAASSSIIKHDARTSVRQAFSMNEAAQLAHDAGLRNARIRRTGGHRFLIVDQR